MMGLPDYFKKQLLVVFGSYIGQFLCGYYGGWSSSVIIKLQDPDQTPLPEPSSDFQVSLVASLAFTNVFGPYVAGYLSNTRGRKVCLVVGGILGLVGSLLKALAVNIAMIYAGRVVVAQACGFIFIINLVYIAEISSTSTRGIFLVGTGFCTCLGTLFSYSVGPFVSYAATGYIGFAICLAFSVATYFMPETPNFYALKGLEKECADTLMKLGRENDVKELLSTKLDESLGILHAWKEIFSVKSNRKAMFITLSLMVMQQMSGVMVVMLFATSIFDLVNTTLESHISTIILGVTQLVSSSITPLFVERSGRKILLLITTVACSLSLTLLGTYFYLDHIDHPSTESLQWLPLVSIIAFVMSYNFGFGIIPGTFAGEMFDSKVRSLGSVFSVTVSWCVGFVVSITYTMMLNGLGSYTTFWIYAAVCMLAFVFTIVVVPETKGKSLIEIQEMLSR